MKCDLCGDEMMCFDSGELCVCFPKACYEMWLNENKETDHYIYRDITYTPDEWARVLKLKAFL